LNVFFSEDVAIDFPFDETDPARYESRDTIFQGAAMSNQPTHITPCECDSSLRVGIVACALARLEERDG
jgi:hypothetical protein